jgi:hypothetical protein
MRTGGSAEGTPDGRSNRPQGPTSPTCTPPQAVPGIPLVTRRTARRPRSTRRRHGVDGVVGAGCGAIRFPGAAGRLVPCAYTRTAGRSIAVERNSRFPRLEWSIFDILLLLRLFCDRVYDQTSGSNGEPRRALLSPSEVHLSASQSDGMGKFSASPLNRPGREAAHAPSTTLGAGGVKRDRQSWVNTQLGTWRTTMAMS